MSKKHTYMVVDPSFRRMIKTEASRQDLSVMEYTRRLGRDAEELEAKLREKKNKFSLQF